MGEKKERKKERKQRDRSRSRSRSPVKRAEKPILIRSRSNSPDIKFDPSEITHRPTNTDSYQRRPAQVKKPSPDKDLQVIEPDLNSAYSKLFQKSKELEEERRLLKEKKEEA